MAENSKKTMLYQKIGVIGAGAWGTALALTAARAGRDVVLWARESEVVESIAANRENAAFLPGIALPDTIVATGDLAAASRRRNSADRGPRPASARQPCRGFPPCPQRNRAGGLRQGHRARERQARDRNPGRDRPGFRARDFVGAFLRAGHRARPAHGRHHSGPPPSCPSRLRLQASLGHARVPSLCQRRYSGRGARRRGEKRLRHRLRASSIGLGLGESARAALLARSFAELVPAGATPWARRAETLTGLSGLGDLVLTATSPSSRNFRSATDWTRTHAARTERAGTAFGGRSRNRPALVIRAGAARKSNCRWPKPSPSVLGRHTAAR